MEISPISSRSGYIFGQITELSNRKKSFYRKQKILRTLALSSLINRKQFPGEQFFHRSFFHILVPQAVDHMVQHRDHCGVEHSHHLPLLHGLFWRGSKMHEEKSWIADGESCQMGATGKDSFVHAFCGTDPQCGRKNVDIRSEDDEERTSEVKTSHNKHGQVFVIIRTSQLN